MRPYHIGVVINFSTNEARFLRHCLAEVAEFASQVVVPVCDHFFNGESEDRKQLSAIYAAHPEVEFVEYSFEQTDYSPTFWHNRSRLIGFFHLKQEMEYVLFIDVDEIVEGKRFLEWLEQRVLDRYVAFQMACYWYFRSPRWRSEKIEDSPLLIKRSVITYDGLIHAFERRGLFHLAQGGKMSCVQKHAPLFHHYSWVRTQIEMLRKVRSWGHRADRDWEALVKEVFSTPFSSREFVYGELLHQVEPFLKESIYSEGEGSPKRLTTRDVTKIDLLLKLQE